MAQVVRAEEEAGLLTVDVGEPVVVIHAQLNLCAAHLAGSVGQTVRAGLVLFVDRDHVAVRVALRNALRVVLVPVIGVVLVHLLHHLGGVDQGIEQLNAALTLIIQRRLILGRGQVDVDVAHRLVGVEHHVVIGVGAAVDRGLVAVPDIHDCAHALVVVVGLLVHGLAAAAVPEAEAAQKIALGQRVGVVDVREGHVVGGEDGREHRKEDQQHDDDGRNHRALVLLEAAPRIAEVAHGLGLKLRVVDVLRALHEDEFLRRTLRESLISHCSCHLPCESGDPPGHSSRRSPAWPPG